MMNLPLKDRIEAFAKLGEQIARLSLEDRQDLFFRAKNQNNWFVERSMESALNGIVRLLDREKLAQWLSSYTISDSIQSKTVGILMAGNIPGVGFHDLLCVLLSGHRAAIKLSSADAFFSKWLIGKIIEVEPRFGSFIEVEEMLKSKDAYIATGSDNSARYFNYYFGKYPHIIRSNRTSVAILTGKETDEEIEQLGWDIFLYFGLGCRNVSKLFVKEVEVLQRVLKSLEKFSWVADHHKYHNNYEYNKSIFLVNKESHLDNGFLLLKESTSLVSPIGVLFYELYKDGETLRQTLENQALQIQCIVGNSEEFPGSIPFGKAQFPEPWDYADHVDTLSFLVEL